MDILINGRQLADAAFRDIESFFFHAEKFSVRREFNSEMRGHAACTGEGTHQRIRLSRDFCDNLINNLDDYIFSLLVVSHELAHYLSFHNTHKDIDSRDSVALEARADNFGGTICITLITFGRATLQLLKRLDPLLTQRSLVHAIGSATGRAYNTLFLTNTSNGYPHAVHRALSMICGYLSFFNRYYGHLPEKWTTWFILTTIRASGIDLHQVGNGILEEADFITKKTYDIHHELQIQQPFMIGGMKPVFGLLLISNFQQSLDQQTVHKEKLDKMIERFEIFSATSFAE